MPTVGLVAGGWWVGACTLPVSTTRHPTPAPHHPPPPNPQPPTTNHQPPATSHPSRYSQDSDDFLELRGAFEEDVARGGHLFAGGALLFRRCVALLRCRGVA